MIAIKVEKTVAAESEKLWSLLSNFADLSWFPGPDKVEGMGSGLGMVRRVFMQGGHVDEKLEGLDEANKTLAYSVADTPLFPFSNYRAQVAVSDIGAGQAHIVWSCTADFEGLPEAEARAMIEGIYASLIEALVAGATA